MPRVLQSSRFGLLLTVAGVAVLALGVLPWVAVLVDVDGAGQPLLLVLAAVAVLGGAFVALVGLGIGRTVRDARRAADERRLDAALLAASRAASRTDPRADPGAELDAVSECGGGCTTCTASCAVQELRR